jgi:hypothetical protein
MKRYDVSDKSVVVVLSGLEAKALYERTQGEFGVMKSKALLSAELKLFYAIKDVYKNFKVTP